MGLAADMKDKVSADYAKFGAGPSLTVPVRFGLEFHYNVIRPDTVGADWDLRFYVIPAVPSALFGWMQ